MELSKDQIKLASLLAWYRAAGVDAVVGPEAIDWTARPTSPPGAGFHLDTAEGSATLDVQLPVAAMPGVPLTQRKPAGPQPPPASPPRRLEPSVAETAVTAARAAATRAQTLAELHAALQAFDGCGLKSTAKNLCFFRGAERSRVLLIGEAPGRDEDIEGKPFVGRAGQLLDRMLHAIELNENDVHIANIVYWRPPGNRTPTPQEAQACRPFLERQIQLVAPEILVLLGGSAAKHILDTAEGIMRVRGKWFDVDIGGRNIKTMATLHPAYLLRSPAGKRQAWRDLLTISQALRTGAR